MLHAWAANIRCDRYCSNFLEFGLQLNTAKVGAGKMKEIGYKQATIESAVFFFRIDQLSLPFLFFFLQIFFLGLEELKSGQQLASSTWAKHLWLLLGDSSFSSFFASLVFEFLQVGTPSTQLLP